MLEFLTLIVLAVFFVAGFETRSYVGVLVPGAVLVFMLYGFLQSTPSGDEVDVLPGVFLVASILGVLAYLAGVALGRRADRASDDPA